MHETSPTAGRVIDLGIRELHARSAKWQSWLDVEGALALAQADVGIVPAEAAMRISSVARAEQLDPARIEESTRRTSHSLVPIIWELSRIAGPEAGGWVHWGATSQNILQTGDVLRLREIHVRILGALADILDAFAELATRTADTVVAGRTHGQHAVPTTFGYKVAVWIDELGRHADRLREAEPRVFVAFLGGAAGTFAALGVHGREVQERLAARLRLGSMPVPARSIGDHLAEYVTLLGLLAGTTGKIGREIATLMSTEFAEVEEPTPPGTVGSSTMPQKRNPRLSQEVVSRSAMVRAAVPLALESMQIAHEGDRGTSLALQSAVQDATIAIGDALAPLVTLARGLAVDADRMRDNLGLSRGLIMAEAVMMKLADRLGRQKAHEAVYDAAQAAATTGEDFTLLLAADPRVAADLAPDEIAALLDPKGYVGLAPEISRETATRGRKIAAALRSAVV